MEKLIIITGTPGTGKSTLAKYLGEKAGAEVVGANEIEYARGVKRPVRKARVQQGGKIYRWIEKILETPIHEEA